jgi:periplasmic protein TonB
MISIEHHRCSALSQLSRRAVKHQAGTGGRAGFLSPRGVALAISVLAHAGLATLAVHHPSARDHPNRSAGPEAWLEVAAPDLLDPPSATDAAPDGPRAASGPNVEAMQAPTARRTVPRVSVQNASDARQAEPSDLSQPDMAAAVPPRSAVSAEASTPHFTLTARAATGAANFLGAAAGETGRAALASPQPIVERSADLPAQLMQGTPPRYTPAATAAGVEADVPLEIVIDAAGSVLSASSLGQVGYGLDEAALIAVRSYRFRPALRAGKMVAIRMRWLMRFQLR